MIEELSGQVFIVRGVRELTPGGLWQQRVQVQRNLKPLLRRHLPVAFDLELKSCFRYHALPLRIPILRVLFGVRNEPGG
jgi:hypothetical protein